MAADQQSTVTPPPMRICVKGWWINRDLTKAEAEAYHLRKAAKLAGSPFAMHQRDQAFHLEEARRNREWGDRQGPAAKGPTDAE